MTIKFKDRLRCPVSLVPVNSGIFNGLNCIFVSYRIVKCPDPITLPFIACTYSMVGCIKTLVSMVASNTR